MLRTVWTTAFLTTGVLLSAQMRTAAGTSLRIASGTTVQVDAPLTWQIEAASDVVNDGTIELAPAARLDEAIGGAITGMGTERIEQDHAAPLVQVTPGGLGLTLTTTQAPGLLRLERGHLPVDDPDAGPSIARWYQVEAGNSGPATVALKVDPSEWNGLTEADLWLHRASTLGGPWQPSSSTVDATTHTVHATVELSGSLTAFDGSIHVGIAPASKAAPALWPNPAQHEVYLRSTDAIDQVELLSADGRVLRSFRPSGDLVRMGLDGLPAGPYLVRVDHLHTLPLLIQ